MVVLTLLCLLGLIFEGSSSSIVSESEKIHLGEEANIVMVRIYFSSGNSKIEISNEDSIGRFISVYREKNPDISEIYTSSFLRSIQNVCKCHKIGNNKSDERRLA